MSKKKTKGGKVRASHILVDKHSQAADLIRRITVDGDDFAKIASSFSSCSSKKKGGDLGWFGKGQMVAEFEKSVFSMDVGQVTRDPVKTQFGYHIIKRTG
ncbi:MAG: peptidylprolyl isomerase [Candidatus Thorarchaeota archaeon]